MKNKHYSTKIPHCTNFFILLQSNNYIWIQASFNSLPNIVTNDEPENKSADTFSAPPVSKRLALSTNSLSPDVVGRKLVFPAESTLSIQCCLMMNCRTRDSERLKPEAADLFDLTPRQTKEPIIRKHDDRHLNNYNYLLPLALPMSCPQP